MPIYEYQCQSCEHVFDVLQKMSDDPLTYCPECGEPRLKKLLSAPNFRLKGGGWYETDFKKDKQRNLADAGKDKKKAEPDKPAKTDQPAAKDP
jgi:putative FmdB family regulatory protein